MYIPKPNTMEDDAAIRRLVASAGAATLVTTGADGYPEATFLPIIWTGDTVVAHLARANEHWQHITPGTPCLLVVGGVDDYVSPGWHPSKADHGRVVPTWNYEAVLIRGTAAVHHDASWLRSAVTTLTDAHEKDRAVPWHVEDGPASYIAGQLRAIVGLEVSVEQVQAKAKLSQGRSEADHDGIVGGLRASGSVRAAALADAMQASRDAVAGSRCPGA